MSLSHRYAQRGGDDSEYHAQCRVANLFELGFVNNAIAKENAFGNFGESGNVLMQQNRPGMFGGAMAVRPHWVKLPASGWSIQR